MAVAVAASAAFLTPIGHKNNTLVLGPGGYRFGDYWRMGLPLEILIISVSVPALLGVLAAVTACRRSAGPGHRAPHRRGPPGGDISDQRKGHSRAINHRLSQGLGAVQAGKPMTAPGEGARVLRIGRLGRLTFRRRLRGGISRRSRSGGDAEKPAASVGRADLDLLPRVRWRPPDRRRRKPPRRPDEAGSAPHPP